MKDKNFYYKKDRLNQLRGFCAVVQSGSVNKAAKIVGVEPTAVSKQVKALEDSISIKLFERNANKKLKLTEVGQNFYKSAINAINMVDGLFNYYYKNMEEENKSEIKISMHHTAINYLLPEYIRKYRKIDKNTKFIVYNMDFNEALEKIKNDELDMLIHIVDEIPQGFDSKIIATFKSTILMNIKNELSTKDSKDITFEDLSKQNVIMLNKHEILNYFNSVYKTYNITGNIEFVKMDWEVVKNFVKLNLGIHPYSGIYDVFENFKDKELITKDVSHLFPSVSLKIITKHGKIFSTNVKKFIDIMLKNTRLAI